MTAPNVTYPIVLTNVPTLWRGDPYSATVRVEKADGTPQDLSPYGTAWAASLRLAFDTLQHIDFTIDSSNAADPTDPRLVLSLDATQSAALITGQTYGFDVQATGGARTPFTVFVGALPVDGDWTHG